METTAEMRRIFERLSSLAKESISNGDRPMPAILLKSGEIVFESHDFVVSSGDPTMHGEMAVIRKACKETGVPHLRGYDLVCFGEPCLMCCGAIHWARIDSVTYCLSQDQTSVNEHLSPKLNALKNG